MIRFTGNEGEMIGISGYVEDQDLDIEEVVKPFSLLSCGYYRLVKQKKFYTIRPQGRKDYQLLYVVSGSMIFFEGDEKIIIREGEAVLYRPGHPQNYHYMKEDKPEVYWMHFSGREAEAILQQLELTKSFLFPGIQNEYRELFDRIIRELQLKRPYYKELADRLGQELLILMARNRMNKIENIERSEVIEKVIETMHKKYKENISIEDYAKSSGMSVCWFIRSFRAHTGLPPQQFMIQLRIGKAKELLSSSGYNITEIAEICGYENSLYFSRIFKKHIGLSPKEYRKIHRNV